MATRGVFDDNFFQGDDYLLGCQFSSTSVASGTLLATQTCGASETYLTQSGATALTLPSAAAVYAQLILLLTQQSCATPGNLAASVVYKLRIINTNAGTLTLTAGTGNTLTGTATLATQTWRDFVVTVTSPTTITYQSVGTGTNS